MDVLSDILATLRFQGCLYFSTALSEPWGIQVPSFRRVLRFHLVLRGHCWVRLEAGAKPLLLRQGDMVVIPHGATHALLDHPDREALALDAVVEAAHFTGDNCLVYGSEDGGQPTRLLCGHFEFEEDSKLHLLGALPQSIVIEGDRALDIAWLESAFRFVAYEVDAGRPGKDLIIKRLSEILFIQTVRAWENQGQISKGVLAALSDEQIHRALQALHGDVAKAWTLQSLAREAGLSRSVFAERFKARLGMPPMRYLTEWRVQKACQALGEGRQSMEDIAEAVGYASISAFSRVFKEITGKGPGRYRREQLPY